MSKTIAERLTENYLLGYIKYKDKYDLYLMPLAWWILNYKLYDPTYDPGKWESVFRDNILNVTDAEIPRFIKSIEDDRIKNEQLQSEGYDLSSINENLLFLIDFDKKFFVNSFSEIEIEKFLPDKQWKGEFGRVSEYLPKTL